VGVIDGVLEGLGVIVKAGVVVWVGVGVCVSVGVSVLVGVIVMVDVMVGVDGHAFRHPAAPSRRAVAIRPNNILKGVFTIAFCSVLPVT